MRKIKHIAIAGTLLATAVCLAACGKEQEPVNDAPVVEQPQTTVTESSETETETQIEETGEVFDIEIETIDGSRRDDEGNLLASIYMEYPVIKNNSDAADAINAYYERNQVEYSPLNSGVLEYLDMALANSEDLSQFPYEDYTACAISRNDGQYLCVLNQYVWYAGGVMNTAVYGDVFDSATGKKLTVADLYPDKTPDEVKTMLLDICRKELEANPDEYDVGAIDVIAEYNVEEYNFYMYDGKIVLCFGPYEIGYGGWYREMQIGTYEETT